MSQILINWKCKIDVCIFDISSLFSSSNGHLTFQALGLAYSSSNLENSISLVNYTMLCILGNSF